MIRPSETVTNRVNNYLNTVQWSSLIGNYAKTVFILIIQYNELRYRGRIEQIHQGSDNHPNGIQISNFR